MYKPINFSLREAYKECIQLKSSQKQLPENIARAPYDSEARL